MIGNFITLLGEKVNQKGEDIFGSRLVVPAAFGNRVFE